MPVLFLLLSLFPLIAKAEPAFNIWQTYIHNRARWQGAGSGSAHDSARDVALLSQISTRSFARYGDAYRQYATEEPKIECIESGECLFQHVQRIFEMQQDEFLTDFAPATSELDEITRLIGGKPVEEKMAEGMNSFVSGLSALKAGRVRGAHSARKKIAVLRSGQQLETMQDKTIDKILSQHPGEFEVSYYEAKDHPELFKLVGTRWAAGMVYGRHLVKDFATLEQWNEFFFDDPHISGGKFAKNIKLFDAHEHVLHDGFARWLEIFSDNKASAAVIAGLPEDINYGNLDQANSDVFSFVQKAPQKLLPFPMLSPLDSAAMGKFSAYLANGLRGLKLISGHGDYFAGNSEKILDTPLMREVFLICEQKKIPVLWHVNTHLYNKGFTRVLEDFPNLIVVNPHFGGYLTYAPSIVSELLQRHKNLYFDISLGTDPMYLRRSFEDVSVRHEEWRKLFIDYADRFLFGIDLVVTGKTSRAHAHQLYNLYRALLESETFDFFSFNSRGYNYFPEFGHYSPGLRGLKLPQDVLRKVYWDNAVKLYGLPGKAPAYALTRSGERN